MARMQWQAGMAVSLGEFIEPVSEPLFGYECTTAGVAGTTEPNWPETAGATYTDGTVVWTARAATTITWTAASAYKTGAIEPVWPGVLGATIADGTITWTTETPAITDPKCPQSKLAFSMAHKVFAPKDDVTRYCVTDDPRDWHTQDDAGFLPTGLNSPEDPVVTALAEYRGRMAAWTAAGLQIWTVDPDPANMGLFDAVEGIGTTFAKAVAPVSGDLYFLTPLGVRSLSIAAGANTLQSGDVGAAIDPLVQAKIASGIEPRATYFPGAGQYWLSFGSEIFVYSQSRLGKIGAWSRYLLPYPVDARMQMDGALYVRSGDDVYVLDANATDDAGIPFDGTIWYPYLDCGPGGMLKQLLGFDVVGYGTPTVSIGFDQTNAAAYTTPLPVPADTAMGGMVPMALCAPSYAVKITYSGGQAWQLNAVNLYLQDMRGQP